ncbi:MAG: hypothetical protein GY906_35635 [bacterium]|nr:hypothetical protein [bacterium]
MDRARSIRMGRHRRPERNLMSKDLTRHLERIGPFDLETLPAYREALAAYKAHALERYGRKPTRFLSWPGDNLKLAKGSGRPVMGLALAPADSSGDWNACRWSTASCRAACLGRTAGRYAFNGPRSPRIATEARTTFLGEYPREALALIVGEIDRGIERYGPIAVRLNVISDLRWEVITPDLFARWGDRVRFYDYTKAPADARASAPLTYALTASVTERDDADDIGAKVGAYDRAAIVFATKRGEALPDAYLGIPVIDGDADDRRYRDSGVIIGLRAKGGAIGDRSGFVRTPEPIGGRV